MSAFNTVEDIANRALQHCRRQRIANLQASHNESAQEINFCYDKLRQAELRRNVWRFATKRTILRPIDLASAVWLPAVWSAGLTYALGAIISYGTDYWQAKQASTGVAPAMGASWQHYTGGEVINPFDYTLSTSYFAGELVIVPAGWAGGTTYAQNDIVRYAVDGNYYVSLQGSNTGNTPSSAATFWQLYATWVTTSTNLTPPNYVGSPNIYMAMTTQQAAIVPPASGWLSQGGTLLNLQIVYPIGTGPLSDQNTKNVYRLPHGFLRQAPTNPKANTPGNWLGAVIGNLEEDYLFEGNYLVSNKRGPLLLRFVADFMDVPDMDAMFCEGLAARIATEVAPVLVKEPELLKVILANTARHYEREMFEARTVNGVETGAVEPPLDSYIVCRF